MKMENAFRQDVLAWVIIAGLLTAVTVFSVNFLKDRETDLREADNAATLRGDFDNGSLN